MDKPLDKWKDKKGRAVLDGEKRGFFIYEHAGWVAIVEVFEQKTDSKTRTAGTLYSRTHKMTPQAIANAVKMKNTTRRISYETNPEMSAKLISAINEIAGLESTEGGHVETVVKSAEQSAEDAKLEAFLKKQSGI